MEHVAGMCLVRPSLPMGEIVFKTDRESVLPLVVFFFYYHYFFDGLIKDRMQSCKACTQLASRITTTGSEKSRLILITPFFAPAGECYRRQLMM